MNYFVVSENIGEVERIFRMLSGTVLLGITLLAPSSFMHAVIFPMVAAYFVLTAIMKWDPIGYLIQIMLRVLGQVNDVSPRASADDTRVF